MASTRNETTAVGLPCSDDLKPSLNVRLRTINTHIHTPIGTIYYVGLKCGATVKSLVKCGLSDIIQQERYDVVYAVG